MELSFFLKGLVVGFSIAAPVGPIAVLCIRRTLAEGRLTGLFSGLGVATADGMYGAIAGFGLTAISTFLVNQQTWLRITGGLFLCYLGMKHLLRKPADNTATVKKSSAAGAYLSILALTLTNPITIIAFAAVFAGLGLGSLSREYSSTVLLVAGVFCGSLLWWLTLITMTSLFRSRINSRSMRWVNVISGLIIGGFGVAAIMSVIL